MKKMLIICFIILVIASIGQSQTTFTVKPGLQINSFNVGVISGKLNPYIGLQFINYYTNRTVDDNGDKREYETSLHVYLPVVGTKIRLLDNESLKTALNISVFKPIITGKKITDGEEDEDFKEDIKRVKMWGGELGFGSEYFFSSNFSIGGEFGVRLGFLKDSYKNDNGDYSWEEAVRANMSYVSCSLNYYFD